jgi:gamma-glutamyltranspeptidase/glutathione hydrolase
VAGAAAAAAAGLRHFSSTSRAVTTAAPVGRFEILEEHGSTKVSGAWRKSMAQVSVVRRRRFDRPDPRLSISERSGSASIAAVSGLAVLIYSLSLVLPATAHLHAQSPVATLRARGGMVVSQSTLASEIGAAILSRGGNAVDAAVATAFALAVTFPEAGNIGGGGFLVVRLPDGSATSFDFRETAPRAADAAMFLDETGRYDRSRHHASLLSVGVPGSVAGLELAHRRLGRLPWGGLVEPAIAVARNGFRVSRGLADSLAEATEELARDPASRAQFTRDGAALREGDLLRQLELAMTLERIRSDGRRGFYEGETARLIVDAMARGGGLITLEDLASYEAIERRPIIGKYRDHEIISMGPPSSGGVALLQMLGILEGFDLARAGPRSALETHWITEAMRRAFADRARYLADPDHETIPVERLISETHTSRLRASIAHDRASRSTPGSFEWPPESSETTHFSIVDGSRMAVSLTTTLEESYGCRCTVPGAGFLLNNEMGDFNARAGLTTVGGLIGTAPNLVAPKKRMLSSMSPTIVAKDGRLVLVAGSPGGRTIINTVLGVLIGVIDHELSAQQAVDLPRIHHQWLPDELVVEPLALSADTWRLLETLGHRILLRKSPQGSAMCVRLLASGELEAGVDRRRGDGHAAVSELAPDEEIVPGRTGEK